MNTGELKEIRSRMREVEFVNAYLTIKNKFYVDIGASFGEGEEAGWNYGSSTTKTLHDQNWDGISFEPDLEKFKILIKRQNNKNISKINSFISPDNVVPQLKGLGVPEDFDFLSLDIDGYDFFVLDALLKEFKPSLICCEINEKIPPPVKFSVLFDKDYSWDTSHFYGFSISMLEDLCLEYSYSVVDLCYNNAFLMPSELNTFDKRSIEEIYNEGYRHQKGREEQFHYNENVDYWLNLSPEMALEEINNFFNYPNEIGADFGENNKVERKGKFLAKL